MAEPEIDVPTPDPTTLTTAQLDRAIGCVREIIETRLHGMDTAIELLQSAADKFPHRIDEKISALSKVHEEKFGSIQTQFKERDVRVEQTARDTKTAVDAALAAQEKAFGKQSETFAASTAKTEDSFTKQLDQLVTLLQTNTKGLDEKIGDLKDRFNRGEGRGEGAETSATSHRAVSSQMVMIVAVLISLASLTFGIIMAIKQ